MILTTFAWFHALVCLRVENSPPGALASFHALLGAVVCGVRAGAGWGTN